MKWKPGQSGNPGGRPKHGNGLAEVIRKKLDPELVYEKLWEIAQSPSEQTKLRALELLMDRGWKKPAQVVEVGPADPFEDMSDEELAALEAQEQAVLAGGAIGLLEAADADVVQEPDGEPVSRILSVGNEARAGAPEGLGAESCTTSGRVGVQVRKRVYPGDEDTDI